MYYNNNIIRILKNPKAHIAHTKITHMNLYDFFLNKGLTEILLFLSSYLLYS